MADKKEFVNSVSLADLQKIIAKYYKPVQLNDSCEFPTFALSPRGRNLSIKWSQNWEPRKEAYTLVVFDISPKENTPAGTPRSQGRLFISEERKAEFLQTHSEEKKTSDGRTVRSFKVTNKFVYGQANEEGKDRFLVFHNPKNEPKQLRFVTPPGAMFSAGILDSLNKAGYGSKEGFDLLQEIGSDYFGEGLKKF